MSKTIPTGGQAITSQTRSMVRHPLPHPQPFLLTPHLLVRLGRLRQQRYPSGYAPRHFHSVILRPTESC